MSTDEEVRDEGNQTDTEREGRLATGNDEDSTATASGSAAVPAADSANHHVVTATEEINSVARTAVWEGLHKAEMREQYYGRLAAKDLKKSRRLIWAAAAVGLGSTVSYVVGTVLSLSNDNSNASSHPTVMIAAAVGAFLAGIATFMNVVVGVGAAGDRVLGDVHRRNRMGALRDRWLDYWRRIETREVTNTTEILDWCVQAEEESHHITIDARREIDEKLWNQIQEKIIKRDEADETGESS